MNTKQSNNTRIFDNGDNFISKYKRSKNLSLDIRKYNFNKEKKLWADNISNKFTKEINTTYKTIPKKNIFVDKKYKFFNNKFQSNKIDNNFFKFKNNYVKNTQFLSKMKNKMNFGLPQK